MSNGWSLTPAGQSLSLGDLPLNMDVSSTKRFIAVTNNGQSVQSLQLIDVMKKKVLDNKVIKSSWLGIKFTKDEKYLYVSAGNINQIFKYSIRNNKLFLTDSIKLGQPWPNKISPTGLDIDDASQTLFVTTKDNNSLYIINLRTKKIVSQVALPAEGYTCKLSRDNKNLYISSWGNSKILIYNLGKKSIISEITVGSHTNDFCISRSGRNMFVANSDDNSVSVIDLNNNNVVEVLNAALYPDSPSGSTTNGVALSEDDKTLYIANADNNCLSVFDVSTPGSSHSKGFIPVGWYPTAVRVIGQNIFVTNGKGFSSFPNPLGPNPYNKNGSFSFQKGDTLHKYKTQYIGGLFIGTLSIIKVPDAKKLAAYSSEVYDNCPYSKLKESTAKGEAGNPIPMKLGEKSPIKYVFYIIKENRTYDQVLGDMKEGNGDASLCLFGEKVTPNLHKLSREFVLLDNFYADGEVSADGHNWSMGGYSNDYLEKNWVTSYGGRGGGYDAEGTREIANNKMGFIWDFCKRAGISYRTYGEFADDYKPNLPVLVNHFCPYYTSWDQTVRDTTRVSQWKRDFDSLLSNNALPQLNTLRIINDHTEGLRKGRPTPIAHVADNDLAIGMFIEYLSKSPVWEQSAVFILEDDAQNGPDHVDAHRTTAYIAGGYVKRHYVDHTMYSTTSMLKTIEMILGIPPMSQYDAAAMPMYKSFMHNSMSSSFTAVSPTSDINQKNTASNKWQRMSEKLDFSKEDQIPDHLFTEIIWKAVKGVDALVPAPKHAAFVNSQKIN
ncbi:MAG: hypothetical protein NVSMB45_04590 [Ginsengibacter sp.]